MDIITKVLLIYYLLINVILLILMGYDKACAKRDSWRIPESTLFIVGLLGGGIGGILGMRLFRHKTNKIQFYIIFSIAIILHIAFIYLIATKFLIK